MAEFWIRQQTSGQLRGPVTSAQLKVLATQGRLQPSDEIGRSREGPWQQADRLQGLQFTTQSVKTDDDALPDFASMTQKPSSSPTSAAGNDSVPQDEVVQIDAGLSKHDEVRREALSKVDSLMKPKTGSPDNKYPALRLIAKVHRRMAVVCLFLSAVSLCAFFYFLVSYLTTPDHTAPAGPAPAQGQIDLDDLADQLQQQLLGASAEIENVASRATAVSRIVGSLMMTVSMAWGAILCFAFAQLILLVLDIERNTRKEREEA